MTHSQQLFQTRFYSDCAGVFQGGGCRAAAFAGAYATAYEHGVRFTEVAGTSAGSIVAALLAAGASPEYLLTELRTLDFRTFLAAPARSIFPSGSRVIRGLAVAGSIVPPLRDIMRAARLGGVYSSEKIEEWIEARLRELTGKNGRVEFRDLSIPLHVVAGDLSRMEARVWSTGQTPRHSVAHAVRASCSIPLFFQPVEEGSGLLVDGGLVSNLPHFVFASPAGAVQSSRRLLLFSLAAEQDNSRAEDMRDFLGQLATLVVDGGTNVQLAFAEDVARIVIPTSSVRATDFQVMNDRVVDELIFSGRAAAKSFFTQELLNTRGSTAPTQITDEHEAFLAVTEQLYSVRSHVWVSSPTSHWFWEIFPTLLHWRKTGITVTALLQPIGGDTAEVAKESQRREIMAGMGVCIHEADVLPMQGFFLDPVANASACAVVMVLGRSDYEPHARFYSQRVDHAALHALHKLLPDPTPTQDASVLLERADTNVLLGRLRRNVQYYRDPQVSLSIEEVEVSRVMLVSKYVRAFRYKQIGSLVAHYRERDLRLFEPAQVPLSNGGVSLVTPPVVEVAGENFVALEGNTRFLYCQNNDVTHVLAVVVRGTAAELPGRPVQLRDVRITARKRPPHERISAFNHGLFRDIERAVRPLDETGGL